MVVPTLAADVLRVEADEAKHLVKSLRLKIGESFVATDGAGIVARLVATAIDRRGIDATVAERARVEPPPLRLWLCAEAEGSRADWLVEKAVELGAWAYCPLTPADPGRRARWERLARAALKQSLGAWVLHLPGDDGMPALEQARAGMFAGAWIGLPGGADPRTQALPAQGDWLVVSGPPEGFSPSREAAWRALPGARAIDLGPRRLRAETAALALLVAARLGSRPAWETG
ncbi:MAG: RsmE family RNA methyltransferase [Candidatus Eisenbacteria bacterium]